MPAKKRASGPSGYRKEHELNRKTVEVKVRVDAETRDRFARLAEEDGIDRSAEFGRLVDSETKRRRRG